jgi:hypothetical protein
MKSFDKIKKLADRFELKLRKYAGEADSTAITNFIRGTVTGAMQRYALQNKLATKLTRLRDAEWEKNQIFGNIVIGEGGFITATKGPSGWVIDPNGTSLKVAGSLLGNDLMKKAIAEVYNDFCRTALFPAIKKVLDSYSRDPLWGEFDKITNYEMPMDTPKVFVEL